MPRGVTTNKTCPICLKEVSLFAFNRHVKSHDSVKEVGIKRTVCIFCGDVFVGKTSLGQHEARCKLNPNRYVQPITKKQIDTCIKLNKEREWTSEKRENHSIAMKKAVLENPESYSSNNVCGRVKIVEYNGVKLHGKWELEVAKWLDKNNIEWKREVAPFNYLWNDKWHLYFPDFFLPLQNLFIEVKGYETERDRCKWLSVKNLVVISKKEIELIRSNEFVLQ